MKTQDKKKIVYPRIPLLHESYDPETELSRARLFFQMMNRRRTVREFSDRPVAMATLRFIIKTASTAPSGANKQPWRFVVVTDPDIKKNIRQAAEAEEKQNYERRFPESWLHDLAHLQTDFNKPYLETAPALIVLFKEDYRIKPDGSKAKNYYVNESVGIAAGLLIAAIHNAGLVTVTHTPSPMGFLQKILARPQNEKPVLLLPVGHPAQGTTVPDINRKSLDEVMLVNPSHVPIS